MLSFPRFLFYFCLFSSFAVSCVLAQEPWKPGNYTVKEIADCNIFDIAVSQFSPSREIRYCNERFNQLNERYPWAGHFYFVHEYGHIILRSGDEVMVDNWACIQIANMDKGYLIINAFLRHLMERCSENEPPIRGYGTPCERMRRIAKFTMNANPYLCFDELRGQFDN